MVIPYISNRWPGDIPTLIWLVYLWFIYGLSMVYLWYIPSFGWALGPFKAEGSRLEGDGKRVKSRVIMFKYVNEDGIKAIPCR
jgi:hypothetical protein